MNYFTAETLWVEVNRIRDEYGPGHELVQMIEKLHRDLQEHEHNARMQKVVLDMHTVTIEGVNGMLRAKAVLS